MQIDTLDQWSGMQELIYTEVPRQMLGCGPVGQPGTTGAVSAERYGRLHPNIPNPS